MKQRLSYIVSEKSNRPLEINGSVAVVGNSDGLLGSGLGKRIDSFDNVFRFNLANIEEEYAEDIGSQVDFFLMSQNITTFRYPHTKKLYMRFVSHCRKANIICYPNHSKNVRRFNKKPYILNLTPSHANSVFTKALFAPPPVTFDLNHHPRNGIKLLACLLDAGIRPTLFGFDLATNENNTHYFDNEKQVDCPEAGHMPSWEYLLLKDLVAADVIDVVD